MKIEYGALLCPLPIELSIGTVRQPTLREIKQLGFFTYNQYSMFLKMRPEIYYTKIVENGQAIWDKLSDDDKSNITMYDILLTDEKLRNLYLDIFNFYFMQDIEFIDGLFVVFKDGADHTALSTKEDIKKNVLSIIHKDIFVEVLEIIQQVCRIYDGDEKEESPVFKNKKAQKIYEKIKEEERKQKEKRASKESKHLSLPNVISVVGNFHPTISPLTVWDMTVFMLYDSFERLRVDRDYSMASVRVAVWGDEKNKFDPTSWYHNNYDT